MTQEKREEIIKHILKLLPEMKCPICGCQKFTILDGYIILTLQEDPQTIVLGNNRQTVNAALVCQRCGNTTLHNLLAMGLSV